MVTASGQVTVKKSYPRKGPRLYSCQAMEFAFNRRFG
jgi:hypothetical protein